MGVPPLMEPPLSCRRTKSPTNINQDLSNQTICSAHPVTSPRFFASNSLTRSCICQSLCFLRGVFFSGAAGVSGVLQNPGGRSTATQRHPKSCWMELGKFTVSQEKQKQNGGDPKMAQAKSKEKHQPWDLGLSKIIHPNP